jgi:preprotein translocase subunit YajC
VDAERGHIKVGDRVRTNNGMVGVVRKLHQDRGRDTAYVSVHCEHSGGGNFDVDELTAILVDDAPFALRQLAR